jgi:hypothetical protein
MKHVTGVIAYGLGTIRARGELSARGYGPKISARWELRARGKVKTGNDHNSIPPRLILVPRIVTVCGYNSR